MWADVHGGDYRGGRCLGRGSKCPITGLSSSQADGCGGQRRVPFA